MDEDDENLAHKTKDDLDFVLNRIAMLLERLHTLLDERLKKDGDLGRELSAIRQLLERQSP